MLTLWRLTLLCGLLISPSYCLLEPMKPLLDNVQSFLNKETQEAKEKLKELSQGLTQELEKLKLSPMGQLLGNALGDIGNLVDDTVDAVTSKLENILGLKVDGFLSLKNISAELGSDGKNVVLRVPVSGTVDLKINPFVSDLVKLNVNVDIILNIGVGTDPKTGEPTVLLGGCSNDPATLSVTILDSVTTIQKFVLRSLDGLLKKLLPVVMEKEVCPVIGNLAKMMDVNIVQDLINKLQAETHVDAPKS